LKDDLNFPDKSYIAKEILGYLLEHPKARDTLDGIIQWWLPDQIIKQMDKRSKPVIQETVDSLVNKEWIVKHTGQDSEVHYRINRNKSREIHEILGQGPNEIEENISAESM
jgi:hypothetical protein